MTALENYKKESTRIEDGYYFLPNSVYGRVIHDIIELGFDVVPTHQIPGKFRIIEGDQQNLVGVINTEDCNTKGYFNIFPSERRETHLPELIKKIQEEFK